MKKQNGITLIALVITIIVLLILAGVSISLVIGDNGILTQSTEAVTENRKASASEDIAMTWAGLETEYVRNWTTNTSERKKDYFTEEKFSTALSSKGEVKDFNFNENSGLISFKYTANSDPGKTYSVVIDKNGKVVLDNWAATLTAANYGDKVIYEAENGHTDWKIFYSNGTNVFLIASDYVKKELVGEAMAQHSNTSNPYNVYWSTIPSELSGTARKDALFGITSNSYNIDSDLNSSKPNSKCVSTMLDTKNWIGFKDAEGFGEYAIGGPTIEMWIASWNAKEGYEKLKTQNGTDGYYVGPAATTDFSAVPDVENEIEKYGGKYYSLKQKNETTGYIDKLYFPYNNTTEKCAGYWLASPAVNGENNVLMLYYGDGDNQGYIGGMLYNSNTLSVRPVVALSTEVIGTSSEVDGTITWTLSK